MIRVVVADFFLFSFQHLSAPSYSRPSLEIVCEAKFKGTRRAELLCSNLVFLFEFERMKYMSSNFQFVTVASGDSAAVPSNHSLRAAGGPGFQARVKLQFQLLLLPLP